MNHIWKCETSGIPDDLFIRGSVPMTKEEIRVISINKLRIYKNSVIADIGSGTGSISIEAAIKAKDGIVYSIEKNIEAIELIHKNIEKFKAYNIKVIQGVAPNALNDIDCVDRVFIGGSGGNLKEIFSWCNKKLIDNGRIVMNFITIENLSAALEELKRYKYKNIEVVNMMIAKNKNIGNLTMMKSENPIYIVSADKR